MILRAPGTNRDGDARFAFERAGASAELVHVNALIESPGQLSNFQILCLPGGFSYGDDVAAGRILAVALHERLGDAMRSFRDAGRMIIGICNGFQALIKSGLLLEPDERGPIATLTHNTSGKFEDRWVWLAPRPTHCPLFLGIDRLYVPVAHGEGRFVARDAGTLSDLEDRGQLVLRYVGPPGCDDANVAYPANPNGSQENVAGICDRTGLVFGMMPHPENHIDPTHHPRWTRGEAGAGLAIGLFKNAVRYYQ
jgi:phosphoribosylformylglycinamidine synthase